MLHARNDYNERIQDKQNIIPNDEPVFLIRAQDEFASEMMEYYTKLLREKRVAKEEEIGYARQEGIADEDIEEIDEVNSLWDVEKLVVKHARKMRLWPKKKSPDVPPQEEE